MGAELRLHDLVALLEDVTTSHFSTREPLHLRRGQIGTVVMVYEDGALEVEFADRNGRAYALLPMSRDQLMLLRDAPEHAVA